ncbi:hypothetical protein [Sporolactobacillus terrae]|uniref:Uncharacterized protein n=1 Tax=Sporolactobacillus terrae TaxID=269673 RepID=A0A5K7WWX8_9BACL|nr:hypothetical protein [Sporolactobacillus terrae]BBN99191.1 hypothetical protein St703_18960 [Sporolactobacillus terrae]
MLTPHLFKIEKQDFEFWKSELPEMNPANREEWLEMTLDNVMDDLKQLSEKGRNGLNTQLTKQVMNHIEKMITDAQDMLNDKRDRYVMHHDEGTKKYTTIR